MKKIVLLIATTLLLSSSYFAQSWVAQNSGSTITTFNDVFFVSETTGWAVGTSGQIVHTSDGGETWTNQFANIVVAERLNGVYFISATEGWIVGNDGRFLHTTDAGVNWIAETIGTVENLNGIDFSGTDNGMIVGGNSIVLYTTNSGASWSFGSLGIGGVTLNKASMVNDSQKALTVQSGLYWSSNPTFSVWSLPNSNGLGLTGSINDVWYKGNAGYVVGLNGISKTSNFIAWTNQLSVSNVGLNGVHFTNSNTGWAVGDQGRNYYTTDGGANWYNLASVTTSSLKAVHFVNATNGWAVGENGTILKFNTCQNTSSILTVTSCGSYTLNGETYTSSNFYNQTVPNANGCDSLITLNLTIVNPPSNDVFQTGNTISATQSGANYQWINCANNSPISGANSQTYTATTNGSYAVIIASGACSDTSECTTFSTIGLNENELATFSIYPNPATEQVTISNIEAGSIVVLVDVTGKTVSKVVASSTAVNVETTNFTPGVYFVTVSGLNGTQKLVIE